MSTKQFDPTLLMEAFDSDYEILAEVIGDFAEQAPEHIENLKKHLQNKDSKNLTLVSHTLKGLCGTFYGEAAKESAQKVEEWAEHEQWDGMNEMVNQLSLQVKNLVDELITFAKTLPVE